MRASQQPGGLLVLRTGGAQRLEQRDRAFERAGAQERERRKMREVDLAAWPRPMLVDRVPRQQRFSDREGAAREGFDQGDAGAIAFAEPAAQAGQLRERGSVQVRQGVV